MLLERLGKELLYFDGGMGTLLQSKGLQPGELPEVWNLEHAEEIIDIHKAYFEAGSDIVLSNTFGANAIKFHDSKYGLKEIVTAGIQNAKKAAERGVHDGRKTYVALDVGPTGKLLKPMGDLSFEDAYDAFKETMIYGEQAGADLIHIETMSDSYEVKAAVLAAKENTSLPVFATMIFDEKGKLLTGGDVPAVVTMLEGLRVDALGINCGMGPEQMLPILEDILKYASVPIIVKPNAGLPKQRDGEVYYDVEPEQFAGYMAKIVEMGAHVIGGCCGTTPEYIAKLENAVKNMHPVKHFSEEHEKKIMFKPIDKSFYKDKSGKKLIAVELAPPVDSDDEKLMDAAHILEKSGVDVLTFPDSPSGRTRADSILMAEKVHKETGMTVMPHICCRDKNAIAMRSQLLGAHLNDINNFLVITGDPIPSMVRQSVKAVFNFDSVGLMNIIKDMNESQFENSPIVYGGAINQTRRNLDVEISRVRKKMDAGATFFLTQPVFDDKGIALLRQIKQETGARILCGIMPFVSLKNAMFMKNEMTGIEVSDEIIARYKECVTKEDGESVGVEIAKEVIEKTSDFVNGYYFSFPFNRVYLLERII